KSNLYKAASVKRLFILTLRCFFDRSIKLKLNLSLLIVYNIPFISSESGWEERHITFSLKFGARLSKTESMVVAAGTTYLGVKANTIGIYGGIMYCWIMMIYLDILSEQ